MSEYTEAQIIKHALQYYVGRPGATEQDVEQETKILKMYEDKVIRLEEKYHIKNKKGGTT